MWSYAATCNLLRSFRQACHAAHHLSPEHRPKGRWFCAMLGQLQDPMGFHSNHWSVSFRKLHNHRGYSAKRYQLMEQSRSLSVLASKVHTWPPASCTQITPTAWSQDYVNSMKKKGWSVHWLTKSTSCLTCYAGQQKLRATWHLDLSCRPCLKDKNRGSPGSYCEILAQATE